MEICALLSSPGHRNPVGRTRQGSRRDGMWPEREMRLLSATGKEGGKENPGQEAAACAEACFTSEVKGRR